MAERRNFYLFFPDSVSHLSNEKEVLEWVAKEYAFIWPETLTVAKDEAEGNSIYKLILSVEKVS